MRERRSLWSIGNRAATSTLILWTKQLHGFASRLRSLLVSELRPCVGPLPMDATFAKLLLLRTACAI